tara:strand:+ start:622 stop:1242 length:621 start_codon:yes stop_codon:yes gene_type:complete
MFVIGLTGGIGTGKSEVSDILGNLGAAVINADIIGHQAYLPETKTWKAIIDEFGVDIIAPDRTIDRKKLGAIVFGDPKRLAILNAIMFPAIYEIIQDRILDLEHSGWNVVVVEAALFIEAKWNSLSDEIWVTVASKSVVIERIKKRNNLDEQAIKARIDSQMSQDERIKHADVHIKNDFGLEELRKQVGEIWETRIPSIKENRAKP